MCVLVTFLRYLSCTSSLFLVLLLIHLTLSTTPHSFLYPVIVYRHIIEKKQISQNQSLGVFTVIGTSGNPHAIRIFPKESCTCPSTGRCYHILAVIGLEDVSLQRKVNLTQLRRNTRARAEKKSGRKAPRPGASCETIL